MKIWDKLLQADVRNKSKFQKLFSDTVDKISKGDFDFSPGEKELKDHFVVVEDSRMGSYFVHIVPKEVYKLFIEMKVEAPNDFIGFSVLAGKHKGKDVRVSCFGVQCNLLGKSLKF